MHVLGGFIAGFVLAIVAVLLAGFIILRLLSSALHRIPLDDLD